MSDYPYITKCTDYDREWIHPERLKYYLYQNEDGKWCVINREYDLADGKYYTRKSDCIKAFINRYRKEGA